MVGEKACLNEEESARFELRYNLPYTESNCKLMASHFAFDNCSMAGLMGLPQSKREKRLRQIY